MPLSFHHPLDVLRFAETERSGGSSIALIVATKISGGTMRAPGALMCVTDQGCVAGYMSNGCVDADIIFQAKEAITQKTPRHLQYGDGSPFKDIVLPCGGAMDLWILPNQASNSITMCIQALESRESYLMDFDVAGYAHRYTPKLRLRIAGRGEALQALAAQAKGAGFDVIVQSPEEELMRGIGNIPFDHLTDPAVLPSRGDDPWTAFILMFHDHDWEPEFLITALEGPAFYIGAMGSPRTQVVRTERLAARGVPPASIARIKGPIGLIPSMRDANLLALSTLADVIKTAQEAGRL